MHSKNYNLIPLSIDQGLNRVPIGTAGGYIRLLEAPAAANVQIHLNEQNADGIPLKTYHAIEATNIEKIFVSCNAVTGEKITVVQANTAKDFKMVTPASDVKLSSLGSYESVALDQLDKVINPYLMPKITSDSFASSTTTTTVIQKSLNCDKIRISAAAFKRYGNGTPLDSSLAVFMIDNVPIGIIGGYVNSDSRHFSSNLNLELIGVRGKELKVDWEAANDDRTLGILLEEYELK